MSLFDQQPENSSDHREAPEKKPPEGGAPLAERMRPRTVAEFVGQEKIMGPGGPLRRAIETDTVGSLIFWGPPG
ncbi:MAG TPA: hypothetical protein VLB27_09475, partial [candidate division Zixibacteria bacterium]|nr:hypothetical protein [candidate division Zixibacteria bacterium]